MQKLLALPLLFVFIAAASVQALSWAYPFVAWNGNVYEVKQEEVLEKSQVGHIIGEVKTKPDDMTGNYYGDASNYYPIGTDYYEIKGTPSSAAIAVEENNQWVRAVYVHDAPFHVLNVITNGYFIAAAVLLSLIIAIIFWQRKLKQQR